MSGWMNRFVAGERGGPLLTFLLGDTLHHHASCVTGLRHVGAPAGRSWEGRLVDWLNFVDTVALVAAADEDEDLRTLVRWLDEDIERAMAAHEAAEVAPASAGGGSERGEGGSAAALPSAPPVEDVAAGCPAPTALRASTLAAAWAAARRVQIGTRAHVDRLAAHPGATQSERHRAHELNGDAGEVVSLLELLREDDEDAYLAALARTTDSNTVRLARMARSASGSTTVLVPSVLLVACLVAVWLVTGNPAVAVLLYGLGALFMAAGIVVGFCRMLEGCPTEDQP